jgi:hypothetical protein
MGASRLLCDTIIEDICVAEARLADGEFATELVSYVYCSVYDIRPIYFPSMPHGGLYMSVVQEAK